jgi:hypothetical protein
MKKHYLLIFILSVFLSSYQMSAQTLRAVNDTVDLYPGIPKTVNLLENDTVPFGDSITITGGGSGAFLITVLNSYKGFFTYLVQPIWGCDTTVSGTYRIIDYTLVENSTAVIFFRIHDHSFDTLDINNVKAAITAYGNEFLLPAASFYRNLFHIPKESLTGTMYNFSLWIGGKGYDSTLYLAAERYREGPLGVAFGFPDFYAGPVMDSANYSIFQDTLWSRVWKVRKSEIEYHIAHWNSPGYIAPVNILTWPGNGNPAYGQAAQLAPFHDRNNDGIYNPSDGDYPDIRGDEAVFTIYNDDRGTHKETNGNKLMAEIHLMAYGFDMPDDSAFKNTIFFNYKVYNRSSRTYYNTKLGFYADLDIGYPLDDNIGCDVERSSVIGFNGLPSDVGSFDPRTEYGAHPPAQSITILGGPFMDPAGIDRPRFDNTGHQLCNESVNGTGFGDSIANNERFGLTNFMPLQYLSSGTYAYMSEPTTAIEYYHYMQSIWKDSTHLFYGGMGHAGYGGYGPDCRFMYPGESDSLNWGTGCQLPNSPVNWTAKIAGVSPGDISCVGSMGSFTFKPGDVQEVDLAFVFARDYTGQDTLEPSVAKLRQMIDIIKNSYDSGKLPGGNSFFGINEQPNPSSSEIKIYPNPASDKITIEIKSQNIANSSLLSVYNIQGQLIFDKPIFQRSTNIDISTLARGVYIVKLTTNKNIEVSRFVKE